MSAAAALDASRTLRQLRQMLFIRRFEEKCAELYGAGKIRGFLHLYIGEEAVAVGTLAAIGAEDAVVGTYREHGHALVRGIPPGAVMAEMFGKAEGCSGGRGGSMHLFDASRRFYGGNAIVAGGIPVAAGLALADRMQKRSRVTCCFFGDGALCEGSFHETLNLASLWQLPLLLVCENNYYAMGTAFARHQAQPDLLLKVRGYGIGGESVDGMDVASVEAAARRAADHVRAGKGPFFLECRTYRFRAHSMYDPELYRTKEEVAEWRKRDPIEMFAARLQGAGALDAAARADMEQGVAREVQEAVDFAERGTLEPVATLTRHVYAEASR